MLPTLSNSQNETSGNGQFGALTRKNNKRKTYGFDIEEFCYLEKEDRRMRFSNSQDPIHYVFDVIDNRPLKTIAKEFVRDSFFEITNFVSTVVG